METKKLTVPERRKRIRRAVGRRLSNVLFREQVQRGQSAAHVARLLEIPESMLSNYKNCKHLPSLEEFVRIMRVLKRNPLEILSREHEAAEQRDPKTESKRVKQQRRRRAHA